ncbi:MAG: 2-dehydropantoate 2-reductase [Cyanobacteria bacterium SZAS TMP-1]|nr:2-dehydropantoate 2-reductase [Cyanobacteria bacterium SZAS TMP-1]
MKIAVMGSGGVGGLFGARLALSGCEVHFIARGAHLAAIKAHGLKIENENTGDALIPADKVMVTDDPATIGPVDYVLFTVKLWDTEDAAQKIKPLVGENTAVISLQNGVSRDDILRAALGEKHILGGISYVGATIREPGVIAQKGHVQKLVFGEYGDKPQSPRVMKLKEVCEKAGIEVEIPANIERALWEKFVVLVGMSTVLASARKTIGPVRENPDTRKLLPAVMEEVRQVATAKGIKLADDIVDVKMNYLENLAPDVTASMEHDLRTGNRLELPWLAGTVVKLGQELNVPTPTCSTLSAILSPYVMGSQ